MSKGTLLDKVVELHTVRTLPDGQIQLFIALHLIHEVTSPQAFDMLRERKLPVRSVDRTFATVDHIVPTTKRGRQRPLADPMAETMLCALEKNCKDFGIKLFDVGNQHQGIVHVIGPELGLTKPGTTIVCGDSHTSTHGAFGAVAFGIGTTEVAQVLGSQSLLFKKPKVRRIEVNGTLPDGVSAKDMILTIIRQLGVKGGVDYAYEYAGDAVEALDMAGRMTLCNMSIEGGATCGYVNPDQTTVDYLWGRDYAPTDFNVQAAKWLAFASDADAEYDDIVRIDAASLAPMVTWGTNPGQGIRIDENIPADANQEALDYMGFKAGEKIEGAKVDVVFIGSCTNSRIEDLREAARLIKHYGLKASPNVQAIVVPGSEAIRQQAESEGLDITFLGGGFEWRLPGCSMCLGMNPDQLKPGQRSVSTSNRNFQGRQGRGGRTVLASPATAVASAAAGVIADVRALRVA